MSDRPTVGALAMLCCVLAGWLIAMMATVSGCGSHAPAPAALPLPAAVSSLKPPERAPSLGLAR